MIKLEGILGNNCGIVVDLKDIDRRDLNYRLFQERGYKVDGGIKTLRGFAKISDLAMASRVDKGYQRDKNQEHIRQLVKFLDEGKTVGKFLPEVILVGDINDVNLNRFSVSSSTSQKVEGEISNLEYFLIEVEENSLKRIDGNHRLEAGTDKNYFVPFSIILWQTDDSEDGLQANRDNEAFLFHFLNGKAKKLTPEENYKGLAKSKTWETDELKLVNPVIPYLKWFIEIIDKNKYYEKEYFEDAPLSQIANILEEIDDHSITKEEFTKYIDVTLSTLHDNHKFSYLKTEFNHLLPQIICYNYYDQQPLENIITLNNWLKKYNYKIGSFESAKKLYDIAKKQIGIRYLSFFVAMPWYDGIPTVKRYNKIFRNVLKDIENDDNPHLRLHLIPIMMRKGEASRIDIEILREIEEADIVIADTTDNNANVIFEIGYALALKKPTFIIRSEKFTEDPPFDIKSLVYKGFDPDDLEDSIPRTAKLNIKAVLRENFGLIVNDKAKKDNEPVNENSSNGQLTEDEEKQIELDDYKEIWVTEAENSVSYMMDQAEWDMEQGLITFYSYDGKPIYIESIGELEQMIDEEATVQAHSYLPGDNEIRDQIVENLDTYSIMENELARHTDKLKEIGWID